MNSWCLYFRAKLSKIALHILLFVEQNPIPPSLITAWFSLLVFLRFYIWGLFSCLKFKKLLVRFAVIRTTDLCCLHFESIGNYQEDMAEKRWDFYWGESFYQTSQHACALSYFGPYFDYQAFGRVQVSLENNWGFFPDGQQARNSNLN